MLIITTKDFHPLNHCSFKAQGGIWPPHCVQGTHGEAYHPDLKLPKTTQHILKADQPDKEAYSGFEGTSLAQQLRKAGIQHLYIGGLATDYCVKITALDALREGFLVTVFSDAIRAVNVHPEDGQKAIQEMIRVGAVFTSSTSVSKPKPRSALLIVDVQNDFCPGGALAVAEGDRVVPVLNAVLKRWGLI